MQPKIMTHQDVLSILPDRKADSHKGDYGKILLICGAVGFTGAPVLASMGALRCGAGLVFLAVPAEIYPIVAGKLMEPVIYPLPGEAGRVSTSAIPFIDWLLADKDAVLVGPGLGRNDALEEILCHIAQSYTGSLVLDADGINHMASHKDILRGRTGPTILTPHMGEFQRLGGNIDLPRNASAMEVANELGAVIVLKGHRTIITDGTRIYENPTGNPGMAVGGSGDVLAGMVTAFLGQGIPPLESAAASCWLHGKAGDLAAEKLGQYAMLPTDMIQELPRLLK